MFRMLRRFLLCMLISGSFALPAEQGSANLKSLYAAHDLFELREAMRGKNGPALYRGAVAVAFADWRDAERQFGSVFQAAPHSEEAYEAHEWLTYFFMRTGHYQDAVLETERKWAARPEKADSTSEHAWVASFRHLLDQEVTYRRASVVRYKVKKDKLFVPLSINGKSAEFFLDTGANLSFLSESEAKRLGLSVQESNAKSYGAAGAQAAFRTAVAQELTVGGIRLRNVAFMVLHDDEPVFPELEPGERGAIGLPVLLAMGTIQWNASGDFRIGFPPDSGRIEQNLCFDGANPVTRLEFEQRQLNASFDTGDEVSEMGPAFAKQFAVFVNQHGKKSTKRVEGFGGSTELKEMLLPELRFKVGGLQVVLHPAHVLLGPTGEGSHSHFATVGLDLLRQARQVTIDFEGLRLMLE